jgi:hypothetical protein
MTRANSALLTSGTYCVAERQPSNSNSNSIGCGGWTTVCPGSEEIIEGEAHIRHFAIHPEWVRRGIGTSLLTRCFSDARRLGIRKLHCFSTLNAELFYRASGFDTVGPIDVPMGPSLTFPGVLMTRTCVGAQSAAPSALKHATVSLGAGGSEAGVRDGTTTVFDTLGGASVAHACGHHTVEAQPR